MKPPSSFYPKVSILMTTRNRPHLIGKAIDCILAQTFKDFELIVTDASSDNKTRKILLSCNDPRIVYIKCRGNIAKGRNIGLRHAKADYIAYCDDDELFYPNRLKELKEYLDRHPDVGLVYSDALWYDIHKKISFTIKTDFDKKQFDKRRLEIECFFGVGYVMHRRECIEKVGYFDEYLTISDDWDMWLRISDRYKIFHLPKILHKYLVHGANTSLIKNNISNQEYEYIIKKRLRKIRNKPQKVEYVCNCSIDIVNNLLQIGNSKIAYEVAKKFYRMAKTPQSIACLGLCNLVRSNFAMAIRYFNKSLLGFNKYKNRSSHFYVRNLYLIKTSIAQAFSSLGNFSQAKKYLEEALKLTNKQDVKIRLALLYIKFGLYNKALKLSKKFNSPIRYYIKGICYFNKKLYKKAISTFKKSIKLDKILIKKLIDFSSKQNRFIQSSFIYYNLGVAYLKSCQFAMAEKIFKEASKLNPNLIQTKKALRYVHNITKNDRK